MSSLKVRLLGPPEIELEGVALELGRQKNVALVAYLAATGQSHSREALITLLWPELDPTRARANLRRNLSVLRRKLGEERLVADRDLVALDLGQGGDLGAAAGPNGQAAGRSNPRAGSCRGGARGGPTGRTLR